MTRPPGAGVEKLAVCDLRNFNSEEFLHDRLVSSFNVIPDPPCSLAGTDERNGHNCLYDGQPKEPHPV